MAARGAVDRLDETSRRILLSRLLTRSGDQAWDFAVPLTLVKLFPRSLQIAVLYYFLIRLGQVALAPRVGTAIDRWQRLTVAKAGIGLQVAGMLAGLAALLAVASLPTR